MTSTDVSVVIALGTIQLRNSDTFPTLFTITVDGNRHNATGSAPSQTPNDKDWRLTHFNPDRSSSFLRLHTLDIYIWTLEDATSLLSNMQRLLTPDQLDISPSPQPTGHDVSASAVVQQLEQAAISDQTYQSTQRSSQPVDMQKIPPPPPPPVSVSHMTPSTAQGISEPVSPIEETHTQTPPAPQESAANYAPLPYNPAAPAAPEPIKHREKTPPPPDTTTGPGLSTAATAHHGMSFAPPPQSDYPPSNHAQNPSTSQGYIPGGAVATHGTPPGGFGRPSSVSSYKQQHNPSGSLSFAPSPATATSPPPTTSNSGNKSFSPPPQDPNAHLYRQQSFGQSPPNSPYNPAQHIQQPYVERRDSQLSTQQPIGGYANYSYNQQQSQSDNPYNLHQQVYRPTESEVISSHAASHETELQGGRKPGKITENAMRVEKGVNRLFKKLEKRL